MDTLEFLRLVWPHTGTYLIAIPIQGTDNNTGKPWKAYKHFAFTDIAAAAQHAQALSCDRDSPHNVFFALGSVREDLTRMKKADREAAGKKVRGRHPKSGIDNTAAIRCFWLDLDVGAELGKYATREEAGTALRDFCKSLSLPKPYVTSSGGGFHAYWPLTDDMDPEKWFHYACLLKRIASGWGLKADPSRTADRASVLRPVGTFNWKTGSPRPVQLIMQGVINQTEQFIQKLAYVAETAGLDTAPQAPRATITISGDLPPQLLAGASPASAEAARINDTAAAGAGVAPPDPRKVVARCSQLKWQALNQAQVDQPNWYAMVGCMRHCDKGTKAVYALSQWRLTRAEDPYTQERIDTKIAQHESGNFGPTLCERFEQTNPGGCNGCPYKGKIKTPLQVVRELEAVAAPKVTVELIGGAVELQLPEPPYPFKRAINPDTGQARIAMRVGDEASGRPERDEVIYEYDVFPSRIIYDQRESCYNVVVNSWLPKDGWREFEVPTGKFYDRRSLMGTLGNLGIMPDLAKAEHLVQYMVGYIRDLQKQQASQTLYAQLGWHDDRKRFVLPDKVVTVAGVEVTTPSKNIDNALSWSKNQPKGDLEVWKKIAAAYNRPGMEPHLFGFGVGFAAPLFIYTGFRGVIVSMVGERGSGKSSAAMLANSVWGHPAMGWGDIQHDTMRSFYNKLGALQHLPFTYDEVTNLEPEVLSDLCYAVSKGQGRQRLHQDGSARENHGNWQTMMLTTSNASLHSRLSLAKADSTAEAARVFEFFVPPNTMTKSDADDLFGPGGALLNNFGLAGGVYAQQLVINGAWAEERVRHWVKVIDQKAGVTSGERFWSAAPACVLTGFELANNAGLTTVDVDNLMLFAVDVIKRMRGNVMDTTKTGVSMLSDYLNTNLRSMLVINAEGAVVPQVGLRPTDKLRIRMERHSGRLYVDRADFRRYCTMAGIDSKSVEIELRQLGVLKATDTKVVLGKGTEFSTAQSWCWLLDMGNPSISGTVQAVAAEPQAQSGVA